MTDECSSKKWMGQYFNFFFGNCWLLFFYRPVYTDFLSFLQNLSAKIFAYSISKRGLRDVSKKNEAS